MTREEALQFKVRWQLVNERTTEEALQLPAATRLRQLVSLYQTARSLNWTEQMRDGEDEVHARWQLLRKRWPEYKPVPISTDLDATGSET